MVAESGSVVFNVYGEFPNRYAVLSNVITGFIFKYWSQLIMTSGLFNVRHFIYCVLCILCSLELSNCCSRECYCMKAVSS